MNRIIERLRVLLSAAPTYLAVAGVIVAVVSQEVGKLLPSGWQDNAFQVSGWLTGAIGAATAIVRRVTPVLPHQRGLLTPPDKTDTQV